MELFWCFIAAFGADVGTGLAGLSAATVMVPIMIVLCPSFQGEMGPYEATAIALASDILGSAFTSAIYICHRNIDLKRGSIMMVCIIMTCIIGSFLAYLAGNVVLGSFSLILCIGIGIRFLLKPDTQRAKTLAKGTKLDLKGIIISLFFGLTIGFGTGFVGSGGGMMMLVVFTAFLGMERKTAVGTSTFIMTFTALIAFISHSIIDPAIVLKDWPILLLCVISETVASIISARFANTFDNATVGLITGAILTMLGITMVLINYRSLIFTNPLIIEVLKCLGYYLLFIIAIIIVILLLRMIPGLSKEGSRKLLQFPAMASVLFMYYVSNNWIIASICALIFCLAVYPILCLMEKWSGYSNLFAERKPGEVKNSLLLLFGTHILLLILCAGILNKDYIATASIIAWGIGDSAAALSGKRYGRHHINLKHADIHKTWEGSVAMFIMTFITTLIILILISPLSIIKTLIYSLIGALAATFSELYSHNGNDTVSVPLCESIMLIILSIF